MIRAGQVVLVRFPQTNLAEANLRPALTLAKVPGRFDDWLLCMVSTQLHHRIESFDEVIQPGDADFDPSGLKAPSVLRIGRLAVVDARTPVGAIGEISPERLSQILDRLSRWLRGAI